VARLAAALVATIALIDLAHVPAQLADGANATTATLLDTLLGQVTNENTAPTVMRASLDALGCLLAGLDSVCYHCIVYFFIIIIILFIFICLLSFLQFSSLFVPVAR
jgi:hypothetical protein